MAGYHPHGYGYPYTPAPQTPYPPPPPPPQYAQYGQAAYAVPPYDYQQAYQPPYAEERYVPPSKRHKYNSGHHYPQPNYPPPPPTPGYSQYQRAYPTPTPAFVPPPPPGWGASPPPASTPSNYNVVLQPHGLSESPPTEFGQEEDHHKKYSKNQHNQASHWHATHGLSPQPGRRFTSLQWVAKKDDKDSESKSPSLAQATPTNAASPTPAAAPSAATTNGAAKVTTPLAKEVIVKVESVAPTIERACEDNNDEWDFDNYFPPEDEKVNEKFSLGTILWKPADRVKHALSAIWAEAEMQELGNIPIGDTAESKSISHYTTNTNLSEACRPVNKSKEWHVIRNDPAFADLTKEPRYISIDHLKKRRGLRADTPERMDVDEEEGELCREYTVLDKPRTSLYVGRDPKTLSSPPRITEDDDEEDEPYSPPPAASTIQPATEALPTVAPSTILPTAARMHNSDSGQPPRSVEATPLGTPKMLQQHTPKPAQANHPLPVKPTQLSTAMLVEMPRTLNDKPSHAVRSVTSMQQEGPSRTPRDRDQHQEDILASLGVTGDPKPVGSRPTPVKTASPPSNKTQEEIFAMLGVTGEAKPVGSVPGPSYKALKSPLPLQPILMPDDEKANEVRPTASFSIKDRPQTVEQSQAATTAPATTKSSNISLPQATKISATEALSQNAGQQVQIEPSVYQQAYLPFAYLPPPPPPPPPKDDNYVNGDMVEGSVQAMPPSAFDTFGDRHDRPSSRNSQHTQAGSDFHPDDADLDHEVKHMSDSEREQKSPEPEINIGKGSLRARKRSRKQIEADEDADTIQVELEQTSAPARKKKQSKPNPQPRKRKAAA